MRRAALFLVPVVLTAACGGSSQTVATPPGSGAPSAGTTATVAVSTTPDMSPVTKPASVLLVARMNDLGRSIDSVDQLVKLPQSLKARIEQEEQKAGIDFIDAHGSFDVAVALDPASTDDKPKLLWAVSIPLKSVDAAVAAAQKDGGDVHPSTPGAYRARHDKLVCDITPSLGDSSARAVCSTKEDGLSELTPWMTRGLAAEPKKPADLWMRAELRPLKERYMGTLKIAADHLVSEAKNGLSRALNLSDQELLDVPASLERELFAVADDLDAFEFSFGLDAKKPELRLSGGLVFRGKSSWFAQVLASSLDRPETPPEMFFRLPKDATSGSWTRSADPALFSGVRRIMHKSVATLLAHPELGKLISDADKQALVGWFDGIPSLSGVWVGGGGMLPSKGAQAKPATAQQVVDTAKATVQRFLPWSIAGGEGDPAQFIAWLKSTEDVLNRAVADVKKAAGKDAKDLDWLPVVKFTQAAPGFPKGSATLDVTVSFSSKEAWELLPSDARGDKRPTGDARGSITLRLAVVPDDAGHFWWGYATDGEALRSHLSAVVKGASPGGTLASRTDLEPLKTQKGFGAFLSYGSLLETIRNGGDMSASDRKDFDDVVGKLPHKAQGDIFLSGSGSSPLPSFTFDFVAGKDSMEDLAAAVNLGAAMADRESKSGAAPAQPPPPPPRPKH